MSNLIPARYNSRTIVQSAILGILALSLSGIGQLSWMECVRLVLIEVGLVILFFRYRLNGSTIPESVAIGASCVLAAALAFVVTQFDPSVASIHYRRPDAGLSISVMGSSVLAALAGVVTIISHRQQLAWSRLRMIDRVVVGALLAALVLSVLGPTIAIYPGHRNYFSSVLRIIVYACLWFSITCTYSQVITSQGDNGASPWYAPLIGLSILFISAALYGGFQTIQVVRQIGLGRQAYLGERWEDAILHYKLSEDLNVSIGLGLARDERLQSLALIHLKQGDERSAGITIRKIVAMTPDPFVAKRLVAEIYFDAGMWAEGAGELEGALRLQGRDWAVMEDLGTAYLKMGDLRRLKMLAKKYEYIPNTEPRSTKELILLGNLHLSLVRLDDALGYFRQAVMIEPENNYYLYKVGVALQNSGETEKAVDAYSHSLMIDPKFADAHYRHGECLEVLGDAMQALAYYRQAVTLLPNHMDAVLAVDRLEEAQEHWRDN
jgi:tetratricopeptide (TPR) repeat protein